MKKRVVAAMSGGVDSSIAASLLVRQGYEVIGTTMKLPDFSENTELHSSNDGWGERGCCGVQGIEDARSVAQKMEFPFYALNYEKEFENEVIRYFCQEYTNGRTPNPCIICNKKLKFGSLLNKAKTLEAECIATGHYANVEYNAKTGRYLLKKGKDKEKDQSYFLFSLSQEQLAHIIFPLGEYTKSEVRKLAKELGLKIHDKPASQEICFVSTNYHEFIRTWVDRNESQINFDGFQPGPIKNTKSEIIGEHKGIAFYTIGQRKGIGAHQKPVYISSINKEENTIVIGDEKDLYQDSLVAEKVNWIDREELIEPVQLKAKIRYRHTESKATVVPLDNERVEVRFDLSQRAITPGQAVVFYNGKTVAGGGWIC